MPATGPIPTTDPTVVAHRFVGEVESDDLEAMANRVDRAFDRHDEVSLLLLFTEWEGAEVSGALDPDVVKTQMRSLAHVERYAVVGAPDVAETMIEFLDTFIPVDAETFGAHEESGAWNFVGARPAAGPEGPGSGASAASNRRL